MCALQRSVLGGAAVCAEEHSARIRCEDNQLEAPLAARCVLLYFPPTFLTTLAHIFTHFLSSFSFHYSLSILLSSFSNYLAFLSHLILPSFTFLLFSCIPNPSDLFRSTDRYLSIIPAPFSGIT